MYQRINNKQAFLPADLGLRLSQSEKDISNPINCGRRPIIPRGRKTGIAPEGEMK